MSNESSEKKTAHLSDQLHTFYGSLSYSLVTDWILIGKLSMATITQQMTFHHWTDKAMDKLLRICQAKNTDNVGKFRRV